MSPRPAPDGVAGTIEVPPSKSLTQRALVAAALAGQGSAVLRPLDAEDPRLLYEALRAVGFRLSWREGAIEARGREPVDAASVHLGNNGTGVRLLVALLAALPGVWTVDGGSRLRNRPIAPLVHALRSLGARVEPVGGETVALPLTVAGAELAGGEVALDASASSQFVTALLLLGATLPQGLAVRLPVPPPSRPYLRLTADVLEAFGTPVTEAGEGTLWRVSGGRLRPARFEVEGDWSAAAFPMAAAAVAGGEVEVTGVRRASAQGDAAIARLLERGGCTVRDTNSGVAIAGPARGPLEADLRDTPDLFPALAVVVASAGGRLAGLAGLAAKESDRLAVMTERLARLGFAVTSGPDWFASPGGRRPAAAPGALDPAADHRIAMALAVAACVVAGVRVADASCVGKSWSGFWDAWDAILPG